LSPLALDGVTHSASQPGMPNQATAGILTTTADLLRWGTALFRDGRVISAASLEQMLTIDPVTGLGGGTFGYCPCSLTLEGEPVFTYVGHSAGTTILRYAAGDDLVMSLNLSASVWTPEMLQATADFFELSRAIVRAHTPPPSSPAPADAAPDQHAAPSTDAPSEDGDA
jgi:hypothetical protein